MRSLAFAVVVMVGSLVGIYSVEQVRLDGWASWNPSDAGTLLVWGLVLSVPLALGIEIKRR